MNIELKAKSIFFQRQTMYLLIAFLGIRIISFALLHHTLIQSFLCLGLIIIYGMIYFEESHYGWYILLGELFLGGSGNMLAFFGLSLRTMLLVTFFFLWGLQHLAKKEFRFRLHIRHPLFYISIPLLCIIVLSGGIGMIHGHAIPAIIGDILPFAYFSLLLPLYHYMYREETQAYLVRLLFVFLLGSALFSLITYLIYAGGIGVIHDTYYTWFRDVAMGKITDMGNGFFRIVTPEHLLIVPGMLIISSLLMKQEKHNRAWYVFLFLGMSILALELSRTYILAFAIGFFFLWIRHTARQWFKVGILTACFFLCSFIPLNLLSSGFHSTGLELLGLRFVSIASPSLEASAYTRQYLLAPIFSAIKAHPIIGNGVGSTISFRSPITGAYITTGQYDWGYLELLSELGSIGTLVYLSVLVYAGYLLIQKIIRRADYEDVYVGLLGAFVSLLIMTITGPALFHVFGIIMLSGIFVSAMKPHEYYDAVIALLYRIFNHVEDRALP